MQYEAMVDRALRGVARQIIRTVAEEGFTGEHHLYVSFRTDVRGVIVPEHLRQRYPEGMTVVLQHQFWDLEVAEDAFSVTLSFGGARERLTIPYESLLDLVDPSVPFGLSLARGHLGERAGPAPTRSSEGAEAPRPAKGEGDDPAGNVIRLDPFRK